MRTLAAPEPELAKRLLLGVRYEDRLRAGLLVPPRGVVDMPVASLPELCSLLEPDARALPAVHFDTLVEWIGGVLGDTELAGRIREAVREGCYVDGCRAAHALISERLAQARSCAGAV